MLGERVHQASERVNQEQQQVEEVEIELDEYVRLWQDQWRANRNSHQADQEINELLSDTERELNEIKNDYRHEKKDYDDTLQALKLLHRRVRLAQVAVDDTHVIDMNGRSIAYRE
jgi:FMN phosphatase YigB (HAD superfamily)